MNDSTTAGPEWRAAARPVSTKMPAPMIAPMPSMVRFVALSARLSERSPTASASARSAVTDLVAHRLIRRSPRVDDASSREYGERSDLSGAVVGSFSRDRHVMRVRLPQTSRGDLNHLDIALKLWNGAYPAVTHPTAQSTHHLVQHVRYGAFVRYASLDTLR